MSLCVVVSGYAGVVVGAVVVLVVSGVAVVVGAGVAGFVGVCTLVGGDLDFRHRLNRFRRCSRSFARRSLRIFCASVE